jgi:HK97 family phage prohead protease
MPTIHKTFEIKVLSGSDKGGRILINTGSVDRDRDRVMPSGMKVENYTRNPVVQWGHNYRDPWATVGKTTKLDVTPDGIVAEFELRPAANDQDPQNIVRLLWEGGWVRTASIGFIPTQGKQNAEGGMDFSEWELLEWSLVPIPANQDALRLAVKGFNEEISAIQSAEAATEALVKMADGFPLEARGDNRPTASQILANDTPIEQKRGRVLSTKNEGKIRDARDLLNEVLEEVAPPPDEPDEDDQDAGKSGKLIAVSAAAQDANTSTAAAQPHDSVQAGIDEASTAAAADNELADVLREYIKTIKEVLA